MIPADPLDNTVAWFGATLDAARRSGACTDPQALRIAEVNSAELRIEATKNLPEVLAQTNATVSEMFQVLRDLQDQAERPDIERDELCAIERCVWTIVGLIADRTIADARGAQQRRTAGRIALGALLGFALSVAALTAWLIAAGVLR